jgi:ribosome biogenesis GTPase
MRGEVIAVEGGVYTLALDDGRRVDASLRGRLKLESRVRAQDRVVIGDRVEVGEGRGGETTIDALLPRRSTVIRRTGKAGKPKVLAANVDRLCAVVAVQPTPPMRLIDRLLVVAEANRIPPVLVLNKIDLPGARDVAASLTARYGEIGYRVIPVSAKEGAGTAALRAELCRGTSAFMGPSGVGKSTLLNTIEPGLELRTGDLSRKTGAGRHTTVSSRLVALSCGGRVADTPGFSDVGIWEMDPDELDECFPELRGLKGGCRFAGCAHVKEKDCAVRAAVDEGRVSAERYESYVELRAEARAAQERGLT